MNNSDLEKAKEAQKTLDVFFQQFKPDIYTKIVLEEILSQLLPPQEREFVADTLITTTISQLTHGSFSNSLPLKKRSE